jgi:sRNA-binding carbon storage regulator CsrA
MREGILVMKDRNYTGGLVITRKPGEAFYIKVKDVKGDVEIRVDVREVNGRQVRVGILADAELVEIKRDEIYRKGQH